MQQHNIYARFGHNHAAAMQYTNTVRSKPRARARQWVAALLVGVAVLCCTLWVRSADAQVMRGVIAEPISTGRLLNYLQRINASEGQQRAIMDMHDAYKRQYIEILIGPVESAMEVRDELPVFSHYMGSKSNLRKVMARLSDARSRLDAIERQLFDAVLQVLADEQAIRLGRVRLERKRDRLGRGELTWNGYAGPRALPRDLGLIAQGLDLDRRTMALIDPILEQYERRLTSLLEDDVKSARKEMSAEREAIINAEREVAALLGIDPDKLDDPEFAANWSKFKTNALSERPELAQRAGEISAGGWGLFTEEKAKRAAEYGRVRRTAVERIAAALPEELRGRWKRAAYTNDYSDLRDSLMIGSYDRSDFRAIQGLTDEQRTAIASDILPLWDQVESALIEAGDRMMEIDAATEGDAGGVAGPQGGGFAERLVVARAFGEQVSDAFEKSILKLRELLSKQQMQQLERARETRQGYIVPETADLEGPDDARIIKHINRIPYWSRLDEFLAASIDGAQIKIIANLLNADDAQREVIGEMHAAYLERYEQTIAPLREALWAAQSALHVDNPQGGQPIHAGGEAWDAHADARKACLDATRALDNAFFDELEQAMVDQVDGQLLACARSFRKRCRLLTGMRLRSQGYRRPDIDLVALLCAQPLDGANRTEIIDQLVRYDRAMTALFADRYEAALALQRVSDSLQWLLPQPTRDNAAERERLWKPIHRVQLDAQRAFNEIEQAIIDHNDAHLDALVAVLSQQRGRDVNQQYLRWAYPTVYVDMYAPFMALRRALDLPGLIASQRDALIALTGEAIYQYDEASERLTELFDAMRKYDIGQSSVAMGLLGTSDMALRRAKFHRAYERVEFERSEINSRAVWMMELILSDDQLKACRPPRIVEREL